MHGEELVVEFGREKVIVRYGELNADCQSLGTGDEQEKDRVDDVENAELFVVHRDHPAMQPFENGAGARMRLRKSAGNREGLVRHLGSSMQG